MSKKSVKGLFHSVIRMFKEEKLLPVPQQVNTTELLKGKVALITGGSGGIGSAIAEAFLKNGCQVIIAGTSAAKLEKVMQKLGGGPDLRAVEINLKDIGSLGGKVQEAAELFGHIDILVNSAGVNAHTDFLEVTEEEYDAVMGINAKGTFFMSQQVAKYMVRSGIRGHILNVTSSSALRPAKAPYSMSKWAVRGFTLGAADRLLKHGIIVNAIAPGPVATEMLGKQEGDSIYKEGQPSGRYALPSEIANLAVMLASDMANLVVGDTLYATGGSGVISLHN